MSDRKHMKKLRTKRIKSIEDQIAKHETKIQNEAGRKDTTNEYWRGEIDKKFLKQVRKDKSFLGENNGDSNKESS